MTIRNGRATLLKKAILLVAYGSANPGGRAGLDAFESLCRSRFPGYPLRWAFTSAILRTRLAEKRKKSDSVEKAITRLHFENFHAVAIQPLQTICGREHEAVLESVREASLKTGLACVTGQPLLSGHAPFQKVAEALLGTLPQDRKSDEEVIFMAHGAKHAASSAYADLALEMSRLDRHVHIASMNGPLLLEEVMRKLSSETVWLFPLLSVVGRHALHDMAGNHPESWKSRLEKAGHSCRPVLQGMAQWEKVSEIWLDSLAKIL